MNPKGRATRDKLISAARILFRRQGYAGTSVEDICRDSGVKRGNLYFYFKSKEELALAAVEDARARHMDYFDVLLADETGPLQKVEAIIDGIVSYHGDRHCKPGCFFGNFAQELGEANGALAKAAGEYFVQWGGLLVSLLEEAKAAGLVREDTDCTSLSLLIMSTIEGALLMCKASGDVDSFRKTAVVLKAAIAAYTR